MPERADPPTAPGREPPGLDLATAVALLQHNPSPVALCDAQGCVEWCNPQLLELAGGAPDKGRGQALASVLGLAAADGELLDAALQQGRVGVLPDMRLAPRGEWWAAHLSLLPDGRRLTQWQSTDELRRLRTETQRQAELLDLAQDFGRLAVWERDVRSLQGRWDRHMYRLWGLPEGEGTPEFDRAAQSVVAEDRAGLSQAFRRSIQRAGTYTHRYRVRASDGVLRHLQSQWVVKNGDDGLPQRALGILMDDTEAWQQAQAHAETAEQLALVVDLANIVVFRHDLQTDRVRISDKAFRLLEAGARWTSRRASAMPMAAGAMC